MTDLTCARRHRLVRFDPVACPVHGTHRVYRCPMWAGNRRCGDVVTVPEFSDACTEAP